jgi:hypothetical protein
MTIGQVQLSNTFNEFRIATNQVIDIVNDLSANVLSGTLVVNTINVGTVSSNLIPTSNVTSNIGSPSSRWKDLYLSGNTIYLGDAEISYDGSAVKFVVGGSDIFDSSNIPDATNLNASFLTSGTVPDARFPATLPAANGINLTFLNATNLGTGTIPDARFPATIPAANGANLTSLNASNLGLGTIPDARFPATIPAANGVNLTFLNATNLGTGTIPDARFPATLPAANGVNLTFLNATNVGTGTLSNDRTTANSANGASTIVARDGAGSFTANVVTATTFIGDGSQLTGISGGEGGGSGSGLFNTAINSVATANVTTLVADLFTAPSTAGKRYIVHSVHVANVDESARTGESITAQFTGTTYSDITFANTIPLPTGSSVELLKKPKILQPDDKIQITASANNLAWATVTIEESDETKYFGAGLDLSTGGIYTTLHVATANSVIESILLANDDLEDDVKARVVYTDDSDNILGYYAFDLIVPADSSVELLEQPKFLENTYKIRVYANSGNRLEAVIAGKTV